LKYVTAGYCVRGQSGTGVGALVASLLAKLLQVCAPTAEAVPSKWREGVMVRSFHMLCKDLMRVKPPVTA
jgi:hypothetical protein